VTGCGRAYVTRGPATGKAQSYTMDCAAVAATLRKMCSLPTALLVNTAWYLEAVLFVT